MIVNHQNLTLHKCRYPMHIISCRRKAQVYESHQLKLALLLCASNFKLSEAIQYLRCDHDRTVLCYNFDLRLPKSILHRINLMQRYENHHS